MTTLYDCLRQESLAIIEAAEKLNDIEVQKAINILENCSNLKKKLIITGVGKSGIIARKMAATFSSIGLIAIYLNPVDALHGDLGLVDENDVCILFSNSGETAEIVELIPYLKNKGTLQIAIVGQVNSTIGQKSDVIIEAGVNKEACPLNLAPTASTTVAMAIGDALAVVWMERKGISSNDFALNHPSGKLGRKLTLKALDILKPANELKPLFLFSSFVDVLTELTRGGVGCCWVKENNEKNNLIGLITDGDLRRALRKYDSNEWESLKARDIMTNDPIMINKDLLAIDALNIMENNRRKPISVLPVLDNDSQFIGLLRLHDLVKAGLSN